MREVVIGLEIHIELATKTKLFCGCSTNFDAAPNTQCCPVCAGYPGTLPVTNKEVVRHAARLGAATNCTIQKRSKMDRKNYFYPDLPKNYQISQFDLPICTDGYIDIETEAGIKRVNIVRIHIEEDAGKLNHGRGEAGIDLNRSCIPLVELVTAPDMSSAAEAKAFVEKIKAICEYTGVSDCKMQEGSLRCDVNLSLKAIGSDKLGTRTETKNLNSFKAIVNSINLGIERQNDILDRGDKVRQQTLQYDDETGVITPLRDKEDSHDYRYFPDPDLTEIHLTQEYVDEIYASMPVLPDARMKKYTSELGLSDYDAGVLTATRELSDFFDSCVAAGAPPKLAANLLMGPLQELLKQSGKDITDMQLTPAHVAEIIALTGSGKISGSAGKKVMQQVFETGINPAKIIEESGLTQINDSDALAGIARQVLSDNPKSVQDYLAGKEAALKYLMGQCMKLSKGKANPQAINDLLVQLIKE